ncbi:homocysteine S-methyltransferase [Saccharopolyspora sp. HNM0983]|uniref:Homocysteine S-methyltransferase n=1 Tax=Saccharopolyspora montiporae TaxID=2781240 RepID=A0A929G020_9PSEU|nr:homocysteine S-methyltransferase [Saccharopolyspora sp. HNM0983]
MDGTAFGTGPVVLDGGLATELEAQGHELTDRLWSARLLETAPEEIVAAHAAFFRAGAAVATTASYQASFEGFAAHGIERGDAERLMRRSVELARLAADIESGDRRWVAASIGPYGAVLADGSEYHGRYGLSRKQLHDFHRPRMEALAASGPDLFALETVPDVAEAEAMLDALEGVGIPAWLSYTISGRHTRAGQPLDEAFALARDNDAVLAVGVNCADPDEVTEAVTTAREVSGKPVIAYPNSGEDWDPATRRWAGPSRLSMSQAAQWRSAGARFIGGCCRVGPADISALAAALAELDS